MEYFIEIADVIAKRGVLPILGFRLSLPTNLPSPHWLSTRLPSLMPRHERVAGVRAGKVCFSDDRLYTIC